MTSVEEAENALWNLNNTDILDDGCKMFIIFSNMKEIKF